MKRSFNLSVYGDETLKAKFDKIKSSYVERNPGIPISDSAAGAILIDNEYQKIMGAQTNTNRITTIIERLDKLEKTGDERLTALELAVNDLVGVIKGENHDIPAPSKGER